MRRKGSGTLLPYSGRVSKSKGRPYAALFTGLLFLSILIFLGWTGYAFYKISTETGKPKPSFTPVQEIHNGHQTDTSKSVTSDIGTLESEQGKAQNDQNDEPPPKPQAQGMYGMTAMDIHGRMRELSDFAGNVTLVVNVASQCGYTHGNYKGLQELYDKYHGKGFEVFAFPCNQFGAQEPGGPKEIIDFVTSRYHVTFPLFAKVDVNGPNANAIFQFLKSELASRSQTGAGGEDIDWNFNKFLVNKKGYPVKRYPPAFNGAELEHDVLQHLETQHASLEH